MECNKDEASRAKRIAEEKMENNDFEGARKIALKARNMYPELENVTQMLAICEVHCAAKNRILGSERDWYGILGVEKLADELTIKKQYRRLALVVHPDKNRFPGAEAAFKLIGEANLVLTDPAKRSSFDSKDEASRAKRIAEEKMENNDFEGARKMALKARNLYPELENITQMLAICDVHRAAKNRILGSKKDWYGILGVEKLADELTIKKQYRRLALVLHPDKNRFPGAEAAFNLIVAANSVLTDAAKRSSFDRKIRVSLRSTPSNQTHHLNHHQATGFSSAVGQGMFWTCCPFCIIKFPCQKENGNKSLQCPYCLKTFIAYDIGSQGGGNERGGMPNGDEMPRESGDQKNKNRKRGRWRVVESSESCDTSSSDDIEDVAVEENFGDPANMGDPALNSNRFVGRSTRQRQHISYSETDDDNDYIDIAIPPKRSCSDSKEEQEDSLDAEDLTGGNANGFHTDANNARTEEIGDSQSDSDEKIYECPDPEFNDFDKGREESCFAVDQIWACFDTLDAMPRFYALVRKVESPGFKLQITWLEADPEDEDEKNWVGKELPVGCGRFKRKTTQYTSDHLTFSHQVLYEKGKKRGSLVIYPRKGESWALFRDWDTRSCNRKNPKHFKYEIVEVLSDFVAGDGVKVSYLYKVQGFVSLFQRMGESEADSFLIRPNELFRFSHRIPCFRMTGAERSGVPEGPFELDPNCIPLNPDDFWYPDKGKASKENMAAEVNAK